MDKEKNIISWIDDRIAFVEVLQVEAEKDGNYGKQVYLSAKKEAYQELKDQIIRSQKKAS